MRRSISAAVFVAAAIVGLLSGAAQAAPLVVFVDDSAAPGGDGSAAQPLQTIQEAIALLPGKGGIVAIHPGTYFGPIRVERDNVVLWGLTDPVYDADGYLAGFTSDDPDDNEVVIAIEYPLDEGEPSPGEQADLVALEGSNNQVHNLVIDSGNVPWPASIAALSADAPIGEFYEDIVFSHIIVRGPVDIAGISGNADALFEHVTSLDPGFVGIWGMANGDVEVRNVDIARKSANVLLVASDEHPIEENGPSFLRARLEDNRLSRSNGYSGFYTGIGLLVLGRKNAVNPEESSTILVEATGNTFADNKIGVAVWPVFGPTGFSTRPTNISLDVHGNSYIDNHFLDADVDFQALPWSGNYFAANSSVLVVDEDGVFPTEADVELGPAENGNEYELIIP